MTTEDKRFNPPPGWPKPPDGWKPPKGWTPDPSWPAPPAGWQLWLTPVAEDTPVDAPTSELHDTGETTLAPDAASRIAALEEEVASLRSQLSSVVPASETVILDDDRVLQDVGIYRYHHPLETAVAYKERLTEIGSRIAELVKSKRAIEMSNMFTFDNSLAKGRKMSTDLGKLMLRAYNAEVDSSLRSLRAGNVVTAKKRIESARTAIAKLGSMMEMHVSDEFHAVRDEEIELAADYLMKKMEEKEAAKEERARLREEKKVEAELAVERERLEKERTHLINALEALRSKGESDAELEKKISTLDVAITQNDYRAANIRAGYVYVISNRGAFGEGVVKIGLTRRLEPLDRVNELGDASVPFKFDVHGLFFSEDAVTLENELHQHFFDRRLNHVNARKEFFFTTPTEVREVLISKVGSLLEYTEHADATEFFQSLHYWPEAHQSEH
jgi:hypothetical protein